MFPVISLINLSCLVFKNSIFMLFIFLVWNYTRFSYTSSDQKLSSNFCPLVWDIAKHLQGGAKAEIKNDWVTSLKRGNCFAFKSYHCSSPIWNKSKTVQLRGQKKIPVLKPPGVWRVNWRQRFSCWPREQPAAFLARWSAEMFWSLFGFSFASPASPFPRKR